MADAPGGHDLVEAAAAGSLRTPGFLTLAQFGVEAPHCDQQDDVTDGPEKAKQAEARDHQIPQLQESELSKQEKVPVMKLFKIIAMHIFFLYKLCKSLQGAVFTAQSF